MQNLNSMVSSQNYLESFKKIANILLNEHILLIREKEFEISEIEFYYKDVQHDDIAIHEEEEQKESNTWYVHNRGRGGIDITFGNHNAYGGILIRGIKEINSGEYIDGSLNVLKKIEKILLLDNRTELRNNLKSIISGPIKLEQCASTNKLLYQGPRIGLVQKENQFLVHPYRFIIDINSAHKFVEKINVYMYTLKLNPKLQDKILEDIQYKFDVKSALESLDSKLNKKIHIKKYLSEI